jgi:spore maturation protein A
MLNYLWGAMIIIGIVYGAFNGTMTDITAAALDSAKEAVELCITMVGIMGVWVGLMQIAQVSGIITSATNKIKPFVDFMFPNIPKGHKAREYITTNIIANILGLGWAATPAGLMAMEHLSELNHNKDTASIEMCTFLIINMSSLQLMPINVIAYRSQYGSVNPAIITAPAIVATLISTIFGIIFAKIMAVKHR